MATPRFSRNVNSGKISSKNGVIDFYYWDTFDMKPPKSGNLHYGIETVEGIGVGIRVNDITVDMLDDAMVLEDYDWLAECDDVGLTAEPKDTSVAIVALVHSKDWESAEYACGNFRSDVWEHFDSKRMTSVKLEVLVEGLASAATAMAVGLRVIARNRDLPDNYGFPTSDEGDPPIRYNQPLIGYRIHVLDALRNWATDNSEELGLKKCPPKSGHFDHHAGLTHRVPTKQTARF